MIVVVYEGNPADPLDQTMRVVRSRDLESARVENPGAFLVQEYKKPEFQEEPNIMTMRRPVPVWRF